MEVFIMKKILITLLVGCIMLIMQANANAASLVYGSLDLNGDHEISVQGYSMSLDVDTALTIGTEHYFDGATKAELGMGCALQLPRKTKDYTGDFYFLPLYFIANIPLKKTKAYIASRLGYNLFFGDNNYKGSADLSGGFYYALGIGYKPKDNLRLQLMYSANKGSYDGWYYGYQLDGDVTYSKINVIVGFEY
jgi:hypothetical protein